MLDFFSLATKLEGVKEHLCLANLGYCFLSCKMCNSLVKKSIVFWCEKVVFEKNLPLVWQLQRLKGLVGRKLSWACLLMVEEEGTCCLVKMLKSRRVSWFEEPAGNQTDVVTRERSKGVWLHWWLCLARGGIKAYFDWSNASPVSTAESRTLLGPFFCKKSTVSPLCRLRWGNGAQEEHFVGDFGAYWRPLHCTSSLSGHFTLSSKAAQAMMSVRATQAVGHLDLGTSIIILLLHK